MTILEAFAFGCGIGLVAAVAIVVCEIREHRKIKRYFDELWDRRWEP
jgi:uncharacterized membrane protein